MPVSPHFKRWQELTGGLQILNQILAAANDFFHADTCSTVSSRTSCWSCWTAQRASCAGHPWTSINSLTRASGAWVIEERMELTTLLSLASADSRRARSRWVFGCFMTALWTTAGFAPAANCLHRLGYLVECPMEVGRCISSIPSIWVHSISPAPLVVSSVDSPEESGRQVVANGSCAWRSTRLESHPWKRWISSKAAVVHWQAMHQLTCRRVLQWWVRSIGEAPDRSVRRLFSWVSWRSFSMCCSCSPLLQCCGKATRAWSSEIWLLSSLAGSSDRRSSPQWTIATPLLAGEKWISLITTDATPHGRLRSYQEDRPISLAGI